MLDCLNDATSLKGYWDHPKTSTYVYNSGITWGQFKLIQAGFAESPGIRLAYYDGVIEILELSEKS